MPMTWDYSDQKIKNSFDRIQIEDAYRRPHIPWPWVLVFLAMTGIWFFGLYTLVLRGIEALR